jgi:hypothetical protein
MVVESGEMEALIPYDVIFTLRNRTIWINLISNKLIHTSQEIGKNRRKAPPRVCRSALRLREGWPMYDAVRRYFGYIVKGDT